MESVRECLEEVGKGLQAGEVARLKDIGTTNQRETTVLWDRTTGKCLHNAIGKFIALGTCENHKGSIFQTCGLHCSTAFTVLLRAWLCLGSPSELLPLTDPPIACPSLILQSISVASISTTGRLHQVNQLNSCYIVT